MADMTLYDEDLGSAIKQVQEEVASVSKLKDADKIQVRLLC